MNLPENLLYVESHEWIKIEGNEAVIGITDYAQQQLGDVTFADLPAMGSKMSANQEMGSVESVKAASEIYCPVAGTVIAVNEALNDAPELINKAPYTDGWMIRVALDGQPSGLMSAADYAKTLH